MPRNEQFVEYLQPALPSGLDLLQMQTKAPTLETSKVNETTKPWSPTIRSYLEVLKFEIADGKMANPEVPLPGLPVESTLGRNLEGDIWLSIRCDPESVSVDDSLALVSIKKWARGQILVNGSAEESAAVRLFEEVIELLGEAHPPGDAGRAALQNWRELLAKPAGARLSENALVGLFSELEVLSSGP